MDVDLGKPSGNAIDFYVARAGAIEAYGGLEQSLSVLLSHLMGSDIHAAAIVFYQIVNTRSRNRIFEEFLAKRHGAKFDAYWFGVPNTRDKKGLMTLIQDVDGRRNEIIHWHAVRNISDENGQQVDQMVLMPPTFWMNPTSVSLSREDLNAFSAKVGFITRSLNMFSAYNRADVGAGADWRQPWHEIFQQPCVYPPSSSHPLFQTT